MRRMGVIRTLRSVIRFRAFEWSSIARRLARAADVGDLRRIAKRRLPAGVFDYIDGAAEDELTLRRNRAAYQRVEFRPRVLRDVSVVDPRTSLLGRVIPFPLVLAPTGFTRIADPQGELAVARAAERAGIPYTLSTLSTRSIEEVSAVSRGSLWFQVYVWKDRGLVKELIERARSAGYETLMLTVDTAVFGKRERDLRRGFVLPPSIGLDTVVDGILHPGWTWRFLRSEPIRFANVVGRGVEDGSDPVTLADFIPTQFDPALSWTDVEWMRSIWDGPIVVKGDPNGGRRAASPRMPVSMPSRSRTTVAASSMARRRPSSCCRPSWRPSAGGSTSSATAACVAGPTSSRPSRSAPRAAWPVAHISTGSVQAAKRGSITCWRCSRPTSVARWRSVGRPRSQSSPPSSCGGALAIDR